MPAATPEPRSFAAGLAAVRDDLGALADRLRFDVVELRPLHCDPERLLSRAEVDVLVTAADGADPDQVIEALLGLQALARHRIAAWSEAGRWLALGRPPQAAFVVTVFAEAGLERPSVPLVQHPLEAEPFDRRHQNRPDAARP
jgi:hypothetical protein